VLYVLFVANLIGLQLDPGSPSYPLWSLRSSVYSSFGFVGAMNVWRSRTENCQPTCPR
jgi:hypothetical protein